MRMFNDHAFLSTQRSLKDLIEKVLNIFKPGRFIMTLFGNSVSIQRNSVTILEIILPS